MAACSVISRPFEFEAGRCDGQLPLEERSFSIFGASIGVNRLLGEDRGMKGKLALLTRAAPGRTRPRCASHPLRARRQTSTSRAAGGSLLESSQRGIGVGMPRHRLSALNQCSSFVWIGALVHDADRDRGRRLSGKGGAQQLPRWVGRKPVRVRVDRTKTSRAACSQCASSKSLGRAIIPASAGKTPSMPRQ